MMVPSQGLWAAPADFILAVFTATRGPSRQPVFHCCDRRISARVQPPRNRKSGPVPVTAPNPAAQPLSSLPRGPPQARRKLYIQTPGIPHFPRENGRSLFWVQPPARQGETVQDGNRKSDL